ncbi:hypothetical protein OEX87_001320 [Enterococcus faecalis]|nr:hypothetical protein [Enterococcus faecalis]EHN4656631.1 hypothetical protein [Enterococcus faecalis]EHQ9061706.1 hypothetical protein [Enterococcus faecalis]EJX9275172.1 hypothetical protein [Enterococcus faecalis]
MITTTIASIKPHVATRNDFYNKLLSTGLTPKETLDNAIYGSKKPKRGCTFGFFAARAY